MDKEKLYRALLAKDPRYDGRFYVGVKTTGIYCRPSCPAKPKKENVRFYRSKAEAEKAGYRPCLRCRPDLSPTSSQWAGTAAVVHRAIGMINKGQVDGKTLPDLADRLGMTDRHLRRLFEEHVGASPIDVAISRRLHLGRMLLSQTGMSITDIALASGFNSLRRFNDAFLKTYRRSPREYRKDANEGSRAKQAALELSLPYSGPYDWQRILGYFRNHEVYGVESSDGETYVRHGRSEKGTFRFEVRHDPKSRSLRIQLNTSDFANLGSLIERLRQVFDLDHNPHQLETPKNCPAEIAALFEQNRGIRIPGAFDPFESAIAIILGQLVSVEQGRRNVQKLVEAYGERLSSPSQPGLSHFFPEPALLAKEDIARIGITRVRAEAIRELSQKFLDGGVDLSPTCDLEETKRSLLSIKGIGPWTVEMIALRCLRDTDAYPAKDLILNRAAAHYDFDPLEFMPWRAYLALCLWKTQGKILAGENFKRSKP